MSLFALLSRLWKPNAAVILAVVSFLVYCTHPSFLQSGSGSSPMMMDDQNVTCPTNSTCEDLPISCLECDYNESCAYGKPTTVNCMARVNCEGNSSFTRTFTCQFCYQLSEDERCCETNSMCSIRGNARSRLSIVNCTANDSVMCLPPRTFQMQRPCTRTSGLRWSTAFLLSFTLGGFGIDRFYLGHIGAGCGKLFSFGGLGVWSIMDVILIGSGYVGPSDGSAYVY